MKIHCKLLTATLGAVTSGFLFVPLAGAQCGIPRPNVATPSSWHYQTMEPGQGRLLRASFVRVGEEENEASIVGLWHVKFFAGNAEGPEVDAGYSVWHSDGTEILNSGRAPNTGSFCLGTWKKTGFRKYQLNHFAIAWDPTGTVFMGINNIREEVTVGPYGKHYAGRFTIDVYDQNTNKVATIAGVIKGTRMDVDTPVESLK